jgi:hypothetical protein
MEITYFSKDGSLLDPKEIESYRATWQTGEWERDFHTFLSEEYEIIAKEGPRSNKSVSSPSQTASAPVIETNVSPPKVETPIKSKPKLDYIKEDSSSEEELSSEPKDSFKNQVPTEVTSSPTEDPADWRADVLNKFDPKDPLKPRTYKSKVFAWKGKEPVDEEEESTKRTKKVLKGVPRRVTSEKKTTTVDALVSVGGDNDDAIKRILQDYLVQVLCGLWKEEGMKKDAEKLKEHIKMNHLSDAEKVKELIEEMGHIFTLLRTDTIEGGRKGHISTAQLWKDKSYAKTVLVLLLSALTYLYSLF